MLYKEQNKNGISSLIHFLVLGYALIFFGMCTAARIPSQLQTIQRYHFLALGDLIIVWELIFSAKCNICLDVQQYTMSPNYVLNHYCLVPYIREDGAITVFQFVEKTCISTDCFQAASEIAPHTMNLVLHVRSVLRLYIQ